MPMQDPTQSHHTPYDPSWSILINAIKTVSQLQIKTTKAKCAATYLYNTSLHKFPYQKDSPHLQPKVKSAIDQEILRAPPPEPLNEPYFLDALQELIGNENSLLFYDAKDWMELKEHKGKVFHLSLDYFTFIHSPNVDWFLIDMDTHELLRYNEPFDTFIFAIWATIEEAKALQPYLARQPLDIVWYTLENMWLWSCMHDHSKLWFSWYKEPCLHETITNTMFDNVKAGLLSFLESLHQCSWYETRTRWVTYLRWLCTGRSLLGYVVTTPKCSAGALDG